MMPRNNDKQWKPTSCDIFSNRNLRMEKSREDQKLTAFCDIFCDIKSATFLILTLFAPHEDAAQRRS